MARCTYTRRWTIPPSSRCRPVARPRQTRAAAAHGSGLVAFDLSTTTRAASSPRPGAASIAEYADIDGVWVRIFEVHDGYPSGVENKEDNSRSEMSKIEKSTTDTPQDAQASGQMSGAHDPNALSIALVPSTSLLLAHASSSLSRTLRTDSRASTARPTDRRGGVELDDQSLANGTVPKPLPTYI